MFGLLVGAKIILEIFLNVLLKMHKLLAAFDFDHTIVDDNTDTVAIKLVDRSVIPESVQQLYRNDGWTAYMQAIFELLAKNSIDKPTITEAILDIKPVSGMCELVTELVDDYNFDAIIISDSNTYFINTWLEKHKMETYFKQVFSNPAQFVDGTLKLKMYHLQDHCRLSTKNLCKGQIMEDFISEQENAGIVYDRVVYVGDGLNDICPMLRLKTNDLACARAGYQCVKTLEHIALNKPLPKTGETYKMKSEICIWNDGKDILNAVKKRGSY